MHVSVTVNWCAHIARRKRTHGAKRSINLLQKDTKYIFRLVVVLWSVDLLSDHWSKSKILSTGVGYEGIFYSPQKRISQLSDYREWENIWISYTWSNCMIGIVQVCLFLQVGDVLGVRFGNLGNVQFLLNGTSIATVIPQETFDEWFGVVDLWGKPTKVSINRTSAGAVSSHPNPESHLIKVPTDTRKHSPKRRVDTIEPSLLASESIMHIPRTSDSHLLPKASDSPKDLPKGKTDLRPRGIADSPVLTPKTSDLKEKTESRLPSPRDRVDSPVGHRTRSKDRKETKAEDSPIHLPKSPDTHLRAEKPKPRSRFPRADSPMSHRTRSKDGEDTSDLNVSECVPVLLQLMEAKSTGNLDTVRKTT